MCRELFAAADEYTFGLLVWFGVSIYGSRMVYDGEVNAMNCIY